MGGDAGFGIGSALGGEALGGEALGEDAGAALGGEAFGGDCGGAAIANKGTLGDDDLALGLDLAGEEVSLVVFLFCWVSVSIETVALGLAGGALIGLA